MDSRGAALSFPHLNGVLEPPPGPQRGKESRSRRHHIRTGAALLALML